MRKIYIETYNTIVGFHRYPDAPDFCKYLEARHRHVFVIRCRFEVDRMNRQIEFNDYQRKIETYLTEKYGNPAEFGEMSCEMIADDIMKAFYADSVQVLEDGYGGATFTR